MPEIELVALDSYADDRDDQAAANAERAAADPEALAYLGDFYSDQVQTTAPILADAGMLTVAPVATYIGLHGATLIRLSPHDGVGAKAIAEWLVEVGAHHLLVVHDHDSFYGDPVGAMCVQAARRQGLIARSRPVWSFNEPLIDDLRGADAVLYVGVAGSGVLKLWANLHEANPDIWLLGSEGVAVPWLARELDPPAAARTRFFIAQRASFAMYGFEAAALIADSIRHDRASTVRAARSTRNRSSVLGRYSIDSSGHITSTAYGRVAVVGGELVWDRP